MPDSVLHVGPDGPEESDTPVIDAEILAAIEHNMIQAGFQRVDAPGQADALVAAMATKTTWVAGSCYPWYWDWWWGYPDWCYPIAYSFDTGSILVVLVDVDAGAKSDALWIAGLNGLVDPTIDAVARIRRGIDQAFKQSPYLGDGK